MPGTASNPERDRVGSFTVLAPFGSLIYLANDLLDFERVLVGGGCETVDEGEANVDFFHEGFREGLLVPVAERCRALTLPLRCCEHDDLLVDDGVEPRTLLRLSFDTPTVTNACALSATKVLRTNSDKIAFNAAAALTSHMISTTPVETYTTVPRDAHVCLYHSQDCFTFDFQSRLSEEQTHPPASYTHLFTGLIWYFIRKQSEYH